jgi:pyruvate kinase
MRKTKIICTIGPASESEDIFRQMCLAGLNVARLNFSHGDHQEHLKRIEMIRRVRDALHLPIAIMLDTKGPEYRIGTFANHRVTLADGQDFTFTVDKVEGDETKVSVSYEGFARDLKPGDRILVNNGLVVCRVQEVKGNDVLTRVEIGGELSDRKSMNFPGKLLSNAFLSEQDKKDLLFGIEQDVDYVAASFVSTKADAQEMRDFLDANGGQEIDIIAKIENQSGVDNVEEISEVVDGIMVARGDLGVEIPFVEVPAIQKIIVSKCRMLGKRVIVATEMLESMIHNIRPTRAEISDVANAVYEGASAVMLSGESAAGKYPVEAVSTMAEVAEYTESHIDYKARFRKTDFTTRNVLDALSHSACHMALDVEAKCLIVSSVSGLTARMVSRFRSPVPIIGTTIRPKAYRKLALSWGVIPVLCEEYDSMDVLFFHATKEATRILDLKVGDNIILMGGKLTGETGNTNMLKFETIKRLYE